MGQLDKHSRAPLWWLLVLALILAMYMSFGTGCHTKQKQREKFVQKLQIEQVKTSVTTTVIDTTIHITGDTAAIVAPIFMLNNGQPITAETNGTIVTIRYDPVTQTIHATGITKAKNIPVKATSTTATTEHNKVKSNTKEVKSKVEVKSDVGGNIKLGIVLLIVCLLAGLFIYWRIKGLPLIS